MRRRTFLGTTAAAALAPVVLEAATPLNVVIIFADDLGYGDLGSYGSRIPTPNLDRLATNGVQFRQFYSSSPVCSPSRAGLLTSQREGRTIRYAPNLEGVRSLLTFLVGDCCNGRPEMCAPLVQIVERASCC